MKRAGMKQAVDLLVKRLDGLVPSTALVLGFGFLAYAWRMYRHYSDALAQKTFRYSIIYLSILFAALLVDHYFKFGPAMPQAAVL